MGVKKSGYVRDEQGERVLGQPMASRWLEMETHPARAWSDQRYRDYERAARRVNPFYFPNSDPNWERAMAAAGDASLARWRRRYPERLRDAGDLERAAATPVPDNDDADLADNAMNLRRRVMGQ